MKLSMLVSALVGCLLWVCGMTNEVDACTGLRLVAEDGGVVYGRSMEWGAFDLNSRVAVIPRGYAFQGETPDGINGMKWRGRYGIVGLDMLDKDLIADGMNEKGLAVGLFYHPGYADYPEYDEEKAEHTITAVDVAAYILSQFATIGEIEESLGDVRVVAVVEDALGIPVHAHWMVTDATGASIVIEYSEGRMQVFDNPLGVITNAPSFDWHMTNLRNYLNLSAVALPTKNIESLDFTPIGAGSGMIGLPGDYTPPSRFVRAVAWSQTARLVPDASEAVYELFRILDNFNLPLGSAEGSDGAVGNLEDMRSSTIWTTAWDLSGRKLYFHTQHNRRVRMVDLNRVEFAAGEIRHVVLDGRKQQDIQDVTP